MFIVSFVIIYFYKLILKETLLIGYFNIKIITNMKSISIQFLLYFILLKIMHILIYVTIDYFINITLNSYITVSLYIMYGITNYFLMNWFLSKYINVLPNVINNALNHSNTNK